MRIKKKKFLVHTAIFGVVFVLAFLVSLNLFVSEKEEVSVPSVGGKNIEQAIKILKDKGLVARVDQEVYDFFQPEDMVIEQNVEAGEIVTQGREVGIIVSKGRNPDWKNSIVEKKLFEAKNILENQKIHYVEEFQYCGQKSDFVTDAKWNEQQQKLLLLIEVSGCSQPWILKNVRHSEYVESFTKELQKKGLDVRFVGDYKTYHRVETNPASGSIVQQGDFIIIREDA